MSDLNFENFPEEISETREVVNKVKMLLLTREGELRWDPGYGTTVSNYLFETNDSETFGAIKLEVQRKIEEYVPEYFLQTVEGEFDNTRGVMKINVRGVIVSTKQPASVSVEIKTNG